MPPKRNSHHEPTNFFYGEDLIALLEFDPNQTHLPIRQFCAILELDHKAQERIVRNHAILAEGVLTLPVELENYQGPALCLRVDLVPLWLMGICARQVRADLRARIELLQRESASLLWQSLKPQGYSSEDALLPNRYEQTPAEIAYATAMAIAGLARQQMLIERHLAERSHTAPSADPFTAGAMDDKDAELLARAVRRVAQAAAERTRRNEYSGVYQGLYRQFHIASYRRMPRIRLNEALEWLERWRGDIMGEPEPPPDIE